MNDRHLERFHGQDFETMADTVDDYIATHQAYLDACKAEEAAQCNKIAALQRLTELQKKITVWKEKAVQP